MQIELENPFGVTKATEFSDEEIYQYWVDFTDKKQSIFGILNPSEMMPKFILGSKGCGKTHLLRYHSYPIQKLKHKSVADILLHDKYIGIYTIFGGINSTRFTGKGIELEQWEKIFEYYLEIYLASKLLTILRDMFVSLELSEYKFKPVLTKLNKNLLKGGDDFELDSFDSLITYLSKLRIEIDFIVNNAALTRDVNITTIQIKFSPGDLLFGVPELISKEINEFKNIKFIYILDELEKFNDYQKRYINTLVWDKKYPCTFWIGARYYGYTTNKTKTTEELRQGSEFELIKLDELTRKNEEQYYSFAENVCYKRVTKHLVESRINLESENISRALNEFFAVYDETILIKIISAKYRNKEFPHLEHLSKKLYEGLEQGFAKGIKKSEEILVILKKLMFNENPIWEKCKVFYFYQLWSNNVDLKEAADEVNDEFSQFIKKKKSKFDNIIEKYKKDLTAQFLNETGFKTIHFSGISDIIDISWGNPRSFLVILKKIYQWAIFNGEKPFIEGKISVESQNSGILDASKWFYDDAEVIGSDGKNLYTCISLLGIYFRGIRYSDKPSEISPCAFYIKSDNISDQANHFFKLAVDHSFIIKLEQGRKDKNSDRIDNLYQLNRMLAPLYQLPITRRGTINFSYTLSETIFNPEMHQGFNTLYNEAISNMTAPSFGKKNKQIKNGGLFGDAI
jgi:hypothetical protein